MKIKNKKLFAAITIIGCLVCSFCLGSNIVLQSNGFGIYSARVVRSSIDFNPVEFFGSDFIDKKYRIDVRGKTQEEIEQEIIEHYLKLKNVLSGNSITANSAVRVGLVDSEYIPGYYTLGELKQGHPERYQQMLDTWILGGLIKEKVKGYVMYYYRFLCKLTSSHIASDISRRIGYMDGEEVKGILRGEIENPISDRIYSLSNEIVKNLSIRQLKTYYKRSEVENFLFTTHTDEETGESYLEISDEVLYILDSECGQEDKENAIRNMRQLAERIKVGVEDFITWQPSILGKDSLVNKLTVLELEDLTRVIAKSVILGNPFANFDFYHYDNKRANRWSYYLIPQIEEHFSNRGQTVNRGIKDLLERIEDWKRDGVEIKEVMPEIEGRITDILGVKDLEEIKEVVSFDEELVKVVDKLEQNPYSVGEEKLTDLIKEVHQFECLKELAKIATLGNIIDLSVSAIREPFLANPSRFITKKFSSDEDFVVSAFKKFYRDVVKSNKQLNLAYFLDNHGEVTFDLWFIRELLLANDNLSITVIPKSKFVSNDVSYESLMEIFAHDADNAQYFAELDRLSRDSGRFKLVNYGFTSQGIDLREVDPRFIELLQNIDVCILKGAANMKTTQGFNKDRYNLFMVKSPKMSESSGLDYEKEPLIFAYFPAGTKVGIGLPDLENPVTTPFTGKQMPVVERSLWQYVKEHPEYYDF